MGLIFLQSCATKEIPALVTGGLIGHTQPKIRMTQEFESRLLLISENEQALNALLAMADLATQSIDLQYYLFFKDKSGLLVRDRLIQAADRGVKVRILVDETGIFTVRNGIRLMNSHPNIEVKFFNPLGGKRLGPARFFHFALDPFRINRRMHNKLFVVDGRWVMTGGRNVGDHYFTSASDSYFKDLDFLANGMLANQSKSMFEKYWSSDVSVPVSSYFLGIKRFNDGKKLKKWQEEIRQDSEIQSLIRLYEKSGWKEKLSTDFLPWVKSRAKLIYDEPSKVKAIAPRSQHLLMGAQLTNLAIQSKKELFIVSPYFIPGKKGVRFLEGIIESGVKVKLLTNSLASTDVALVHGCYLRYRDEMLRLGVQVYELKPNAHLKKRWKRASPSSRASLHAKTFVFDGEKVFVGSYNVDPRSANLNTEMGVLAENEELSQQVLQILQEATQPEASYRLVLNSKGRPEWHTVERGESVIYHSDPKAKMCGKLTSFWSYFLPIEDQL